MCFLTLRIWVSMLVAMTLNKSAMVQGEWKDVSNIHVEEFVWYEVVGVYWYYGNMYLYVLLRCSNTVIWADLFLCSLFWSSDYERKWSDGMLVLLDFIGVTVFCCFCLWLWLVTLLILSLLLTCHGEAKSWICARAPKGNDRLPFPSIFSCKQLQSLKLTN